MYLQARNAVYCRLHLLIAQRTDLSMRTNGTCQIIICPGDDLLNPVQKGGYPEDDNGYDIRQGRICTISRRPQEYAHLRLRSEEVGISVSHV